MNPQLVAPESAKTGKGERTRQHILETALALFRERGYERTTLRAIAAESGVSLGSAYYYFESKEQLIQSFYHKTHREHLEAATTILEQETNLKKRLLGVMRTKLDTIMPYQRFSGILFKTAGDPRSPLNPFSEESNPVRQESTALFREVIEGSKARIAPQLRDALPQMLWTYHMAIVLYWIHDTSAGCDRSYRLMEHTVDLIVRLIGMGSMKVMRPLLKSSLALMKDLRLDSGLDTERKRS